jgi:C1A family cysteine protease
MARKKSSPAGKKASPARKKVLPASSHSYSFGWKRQKPDHRDWHFTVPRRVTAILPPKVDLSANMPPLLNQGQLGSCGPNSADECIEYDDRVEKLPVISASRLFIYWVTRSMAVPSEIDRDSGVDNRTMLKALAQYGFCPESMWPYDISKFKEKPPQACFTAALAHRIKSYAVVQQTLEQMKGCIYSGFPFIFGFEVYSSFMTPEVAATGIVPMPNPSKETLEGGHDVTFFGYDDTKQVFKFRNHWVKPDGTPWGDNGNGYFPYAYAVSSLASDFWAINAVPT